MDVAVLERHNPWWRDGALPERYGNTVRRELLPEVAHALSPSRAVTVLGPRRVGKTILLHQLVGTLLSDGVPARNIVYLPADDRLLGEPATLLKEVTDFIQNSVGSLKSDGGSGGVAYLLVDEIHAVPDWPLLVKRFIDIGDPLVWVLTSSAGAVLRGKSTESLAGRVASYSLFPFSLAESAVLSGNAAAAMLRRAAEVWRAYGVGPVEGERAEALAELQRESVGRQGELQAVTRRYLRMGGFPEYLTQDDETLRERYFWDTVVERVLYLDVPAIAEVRNPQLMHSLTHRLLAAGPCLLNIADLSRDLGTTHLTIREYLRVVEATMLDFVLDRYAGTLPVRQAGLKKSVPVDCGLVVELSGWDMDGAQASTYEGRLAEVAVHAWLRRHRVSYEIGHWRRRGKEVDFVASAPKWLLPIEVKWREERRARGLSGVDEFQRFHETDGSLVITRDAFGHARGRTHVPLWMLG